MMDWQPIETAPKDGTKVLIVNDYGVMDVAEFVPEWYERKEFVRTAKDGDVYKTVREDIGYWNADKAHCPTHWMPLPPLPDNALGNRRAAFGASVLTDGLEGN